MAKQPGLEKIPVTGVSFKGGFRAFRLGRRVRHHLAPVNALRPPQQRHARLAETAFPERLRPGQHIRNGAYAQRRKRRKELLPHTGNARQLQLLQKARHILMPQQIQPVGLVEIGTYLRQKLHRRDAHGAGQPARGSAHRPLERHAHLFHRPEQAFQPCGVQIGLVDGSHFHQRGKIVQHALNHARHLPVSLMSAGHEHAVRAQPFRLSDGHGRVHAESAGLVGAGAHHAPPALPDNQGLAAQFRIVQLLDGREKGVHVDMHEPAEGADAAFFGAVCHGVFPERSAVESIFRPEPCIRLRRFHV